MFYYRAFDELVTTRNYELGPIPYHHINQYCDEYGLSETEREEARFVINAVDNWHVARVRETQAKAAKKGSKRKR